MIKIILKILRYLLVIIVAILILAIIPYLLCPIYDFPPARPFSGQHWHNPYAGIDSLNWRKSNFQVQSRVWGGLTSGRTNSNEEIHQVYKNLGFDYIVTSDYQSINAFGKDDPSYIACYEHGYGIKKEHQVLIGSHKVLWLEYVLYQTVHQKQNILNHLRADNDIVSIAHPRLRWGYSLEDMGKLCNYDLMEVFNQIRFSIPHWDAALSAGRVVYVLSDDDAHNIKDPAEVGRCCTFIYSPENTGTKVIQALKDGRAYGADVFMAENENWETKTRKAFQIPKLKRMEIRGDSLIVEVTRQAFSIRFFGQNGVLRSEILNQPGAAYKLQSGDSYIRTEIVFPAENGGPGTRFILNPVYRYTGDPGEYKVTASVNMLKTYIYRLLILFVLGIAFGWWYRKRRKVNHDTSPGNS